MTVAVDVDYGCDRDEDEEEEARDVHVGVDTGDVCGDFVVQVFRGHSHGYGRGHGQCIDNSPNIICRWSRDIEIIAKLWLKIVDENKLSIDSSPTSFIIYWWKRDKKIITKQWIKKNI